jgi:hypothetical protein
MYSLSKQILLNSVLVVRTNIQGNLALLLQKPISIFIHFLRNTLHRNRNKLEWEFCSFNNWPPVFFRLTYLTES